MPLAPGEESVQKAMRLYLKIRSLSVPTLKLLGEYDRVNHYGTRGLHGDVEFLLASNWLALAYGGWITMRIRGSLDPEYPVPNINDAIREWCAELNFWSNLPRHQRIVLGHEWDKLPLYLAGCTPEGALTVRKCTFGDWWGHFQE